jgi:hypothetical protein
MLLLLLLQLISLSSVAFGQFFPGAHPLAGGHSGLSLSPYVNGESEQLPISQEELAQLMAQSLATSHGKNYGPPPFAKKQPKHSHNEDSESEDFPSNYETGGDDTPSHPQPPQAPAPPQQPHEEPNEGGEEQQGGYDQQEGGDDGEGAPYQQHGNSDEQGEQGGTDERENDGYENSGPNHQQEGGHYQSQSGQYPPNSYGSHSSEEQQREPHSGAYEDNQRGPQYDDSPRAHPYGPQSGSQRYQNSPDYRSRDNAVDPRGHQYSNDYSYSGPGSGYSGPGSESYLNYVIRSSPKSLRYRS